MIPKNFDIDKHIERWFAEDVGNGDHSSLAAIPTHAERKVRLIIKDNGVLAGVELAKYIFNYVDSSFVFTQFIEDGTLVKYGDIAFIVEGKAQKLLTTERLVLNLMQRMSGIATKTAQFVKLTEGTNAKLLDTRKTTPGLRQIEKWATRIGGGYNHRMGLYDMIMLKDNHVDFCGSIEKAVTQTKAYLKSNMLDIKIEVEVRNLNELQQVLDTKQVDRVMFDNFTPQEVIKALEVVRDSGTKIETEASGGINLKTIRAYAETNVDYISVGALTHSYNSLDMSLKAFI
ncbi:UNVERIFIED_CONTAM: hypothetical protein GTU68_045111 [Idotea baltica]|nr:hypothetical protein [Idotea baltica]